MFLVNKSFIKFITDFGPLLVFLSFYYKNEKNLTVAIPPFIVATLIALTVVWLLEKKIPKAINQLKRLKEVEKENQRLRKAVSELTLDKLILKEAVSGKY